MVKEIVRLFAHVDSDFSGQGRDHRARQRGLATLGPQNRQHVRGGFAESVQQGHVDDAGLARNQGLNGTSCFRRIAQIA